MTASPLAASAATAGAGPQPIAEPVRSPWPRVAAGGIVLAYLVATAAVLLLDRRLPTIADEPVQGVPIWLGFAMFTAVGALIVARRPHHRLGWLMSGTGLLVAWGVTGDYYAAYVMTTRGRPDALALLGAWVQAWYWLAMLAAVGLALPLLFPDGRLPSRRWRPFAALVATGTAIPIVLAMLTGTLTGQEVDYRIDNPIGIDGLGHVEQSAVVGAVGGVVFTAGMVGAVVALTVRFRRSRGPERQQVKVFLVAVVPLCLLPAAELLSDVVGEVMFVWTTIALPVAVAVAVLRYRLDDIDVVINRALVYGLLTAGVIGVYVLVVGYLGAALRRDDELAISLVATGLVAVLFAPARDRLQRAVDRLLYGRRAEPYTALAQLGERLESTLAPEAVLPAIVGTVRETLRLPYAAVRLADDATPVEAGARTRVVETLPLLHHGVPVGTLELGPRPGETAFSPADRRLLADLARQAGVAVSTVRLTADLQRARERLVTAREEERRRLRRDLHDGLGAQLAGLTVQTGVLRSLIPRDPRAADALAAELRGELRSAIADVRRLVHGLRPPALDELGLVGALERLAEGVSADAAGPRITVEIPGELPPLPAAVEVAAYRVVSEALTNVVRHAHARTCTVALRHEPAAVTVEVVDDGVGITTSVEPGVGLASMRERATEMGGTCRVEPVPDGGTRVLARLPLGEEGAR